MVTSPREPEPHVSLYSESTVLFCQEDLAVWFFLSIWSSEVGVKRESKQTLILSVLKMAWFVQAFSLPHTIFLTYLSRAYSKASLKPVQGSPHGDQSGALESSFMSGTCPGRAPAGQGQGLRPRSSQPSQCQERTDLLMIFFFLSFH